MIAIKPEIIEQIKSDEDAMHIAADYGYSLKDIETAINLYKVKGTPCENCHFAACSLSPYPCNVCKRNKKDMFMSFCG